MQERVANTTFLWGWEKGKDDVIEKHRKTGERIRTEEKVPQTQHYSNLSQSCGESKQYEWLESVKSAWEWV